MRQNIYYDEEHGVVRIEHHVQLTTDDARHIVDTVVKLTEGKEHRYMLHDVSRISLAKLDKEIRKEFSDAGNRIQFEKVAMVGADPMTRMMSKVILALSGDSKNTRFFKTTEEAIAWMKGDSNEL